MVTDVVGVSVRVRAEQLAQARVPFVQAVVVRAVHPTSAHAGDTALVHADGRIEGFVGGTCAESAVRLHALEVLLSGEPLLLRVTAGAAGTTAGEGVVTVANPCVSGGTVEIFLEPRRPAPRLLVVGTTPVAHALVALGAPLGFDVESGDEVGDCDGAAAVVVASHGRGETEAIEAALRARVGYVGLVASRIRAASVLAGMADADVVHSPAGLDIGGRTGPEIALSILAEIVATRRRGSAAPPAGVSPAVVSSGSATDPVCRMTVARSDQSPHAEGDAGTHWFCCEACRTAYVADPGRYAAV